MPEPMSKIRSVISKISGKDDDPEIIERAIKRPLDLLNSGFNVPKGLKDALEKRVRSHLKRIQTRNKVSEEVMDEVWKDLKIPKEPEK